MEQPGSVISGRLDGLTSLRFFASLIVVLFHCSQESLNFLPLVLRGMMKSGYEAVTFFFVLSGFVLAYSYGRAPSRWVRGGALLFWKQRFARIYPIYLFAIIVALPRFFYAVRVGTVRPDDVPASLIAVPLLLQSWFLSTAISGAINLPAWSLSVEAFFYATFPLLLGLIIAKGLIRTASIAYIGLVCWDSLFPKSAFAFFPLYHLATFIIGTSCGLWFRNAARKPMKILGYSAATLLCGILGFRDLLPIFFVSRAILLPLFAALIIAVATGVGRFKLLEHPFLVLLGDSSYCLYILHLPLYGYFGSVLKRVNVNITFNLPAGLCYLIVIVVISVFAHRWIELPARSWLMQTNSRTTLETSPSARLS